jgi:hypothetical protein
VGEVYELPVKTVQPNSTLRFHLVQILRHQVRL